MSRLAGVLLPISSLPGTLGIGDFGENAYQWIDYLSSAKAGLWQLLPLNPVGYGNSPYQTYSSFAGDEIYICVEEVYRFLKLEFNVETVVCDHVDYGTVRSQKYGYLWNAFQHFIPDTHYNDFLEEAFWLNDFSEFMALRKINQCRAWLEWDQFAADPQEVQYQKFLQYMFFKQWQQLKQYANQKGIQLVGDLPIYVGHDSAEVYFNRRDYHLDSDGRPTLVAGVPPDYFSSEGQLWGNPIYHWERMKKDDYIFWEHRLSWNQKLFDVIRIDHFRAFDTYWAIDAASKHAINGTWKLGPSNHFFERMYSKLPHLNLVVEDLGDLRPEVLKLRDDFNLMGMQIIQFSLKPEEIERDQKMTTNLLIYTGTHDNETLGGWQATMSLEDQSSVSDNLSRIGIMDKNIIDQICHYTLSLNADWAILPLQDIMRLGIETRINRPATIGSPNWEWKLTTMNHLETAMNRFKNWIEATQRVAQSTIGKEE